MSALVALAAGHDAVSTRQHTVLFIDTSSAFTVMSEIAPCHTIRMKCSDLFVLQTKLLLDVEVLLLIYDEAYSVKSATCANIIKQPFTFLYPTEAQNK